jgi:Tfp pilus assembly protein PilF
LNLGERLAAARQTYASYLALLFLPLNNAPERPFPLPAAWATPEAIAGALGTFALFLIALRSLRARSPLSLFLLWPFLSLLPAANFFPLASRPLAEQRLYFPAVGVCALIGLAGDRLRELFARAGRATGRSAADCALCFLFIFFAASTAIRDRDWRDEITLFEKAKKFAPTLRVRLNLANAYLRSGEPVKAVNECVDLLRLDPALAEGHAALSDGYARMGLLEKAGEELERARTLNPRHTGILNNLGLLYIRTGREAEAEEIFRRILSLDGENREAMNNLAACLSRRGRDREAREMWERVLAIDPGNPVAKANKTVISNQ